MRTLVLSLAAASLITACTTHRAAQAPPPESSDPIVLLHARQEAARHAASVAAPVFNPELIVGDTRVVLVSVMRGSLFSPGALLNLDNQPRAVPYIRLEFVVTTVDGQPTTGRITGTTDFLVNGQEFDRPSELVARGVSGIYPFEKQQLEDFGIPNTVSDTKGCAFTRIEWFGGLSMPGDRVDIHIRQGTHGELRDFIFRDVPIGGAFIAPQPAVAEAR